MSTIARRLTVDQYDQMIEDGILPETNRFELIEGRIVEKEAKPPAHCMAAERTRRAVEPLLPAGWHSRNKTPVRIPSRDSEPEPDAPSSAATSRITRPGIPVPRTSPWSSRSPRHGQPGPRPGRDLRRRRHPRLLDRQPADRQVEVYTEPDPAGGYRSRADYRPGQDVPVEIAGQVVGQIAMADLLP